MPSSASQEMCDALDAQDIAQIQTLIQNGESQNGFYERDMYEGSYTTLLAKAAREGWLDVVRVLLENSADTEIPCIDSETPLTLAASVGWYEIVTLLVEYGADIDYKTRSGVSAFDKAFRESHKVNYQRILQFLRSQSNPK